MNEVLESLFLGRELYFELLAPTAEKNGLSHTELAVLMFLRSEAARDTATDIARVFRIKKPSLSMAVRRLEERGLISGARENGNRRSVHLRLSAEAEKIADAGLSAQKDFISVVTGGFSAAELSAMREMNVKVSENIKTYHMHALRSRSKEESGEIYADAGI